MNTKAAEIAKQANALFGADAVRLGSDPYYKARFLTTGVFPIDFLLGGGLPRGRFTEFYGNFSTLKSLIALHAMAETQKAGGVAVLIDTEHSFDPDWATLVGVDVGELIIQQPETGEVAVDLTEAFIRAGVDLVVWDSVAATLPQAEHEKKSTEPVQPARLAALMSKGLRKLNTANKNHTAVLCINQIREKVGIVFGSNESVPGGRSLPFYASHRIAMRKAGVEKQKIKVHNGEKYEDVTEYLGQRIRATLEKSKLTSPHREVSFLYDFRTADVDTELFITGQGLEHGLIDARGSSWSIAGSEKTIKGRENFIDWLRENPREVEKLKRKLMALTLPLDSPGESTPRKKRVVGPKPASSDSEVPDSTPEVEPVASRTTAAPKKRASKSSTPLASPSPSTPKTSRTRGGKQ